jgi:predicted porin
MMKTILCAGALAALCMDAGAADGSSVNVYGLVDVALVRETGGSAGDVTKITSGVGAGSRLGFKGREDLGGGLAAVFLLESGFQADTGALGQGGLLFGRQAYAGLQGGFGTLTAGRQYTPQYLTVVMADPFGSGYAGDTKNLMAPTGNSASRMDNSLKYVSPAAGPASVRKPCTVPAKWRATARRAGNSAARSITMRARSTPGSATTTATTARRPSGTRAMRKTRCWPRSTTSVS